jgi:hypothetical protein
MRELVINQATGLQSLSLQLSPKLVAMTSHGKQQGELPLLWSLCTTWVDMGLPVLVLDGHAQETSKNPGLLQMLTESAGHPCNQYEPQSWTILPAALGFKQLAATGFGTHALGDLFQNYGVVMIYTNATMLTNMFTDSELTPLLVVAPLKASSISAYLALKQLLINAHLRPTVANIALVPQATSVMPSPTQNLQYCAETFLGLTFKPIVVSAVANVHDSQDQIERLALQLLENALFLERHPTQRTH